MGKAVGDKIDKMDAQRNSRNRKIRFFLDKMKAEGEQQDSFAKLVRDLFVNILAIKDAFPKMIIARTKHDGMQHKGVEIVYIARWLVDSHN